VLHRQAQKPGRELIDEGREGLLIAALQRGDELALAGVIVNGGGLGVGQASCSATEITRPRRVELNSTFPALVAKIV
jgi:hypothetical protein